jgi:hypothetical protein
MMWAWCDMLNWMWLNADPCQSWGSLLTEMTGPGLQVESTWVESQTATGRAFHQEAWYSSNSREPALVEEKAEWQLSACGPRTWGEITIATCHITTFGPKNHKYDSGHIIPCRVPSVHTFHVINTNNPSWLLGVAFLPRCRGRMVVRTQIWL